MIDEKYTKYANDVVNGDKVACRLTRLACKRYLSLIKKKDYYLDTDEIDRIEKFFLNFKHFTGKKDVGRPFVLSDWQYFMICHIYGLKRKKDKMRVTRTAYIEVARKAGKSSFVAILCLYHLIADKEHNAEVILAANSHKQASILFKMASTYLGQIDKKNKWFKRYRDSIRFDAMHSILDVVSADASKLDGHNCSMFVCDELHEAPNGDVWRVLETSQGNREQPLAVAITTAGFDQSSFCFSMRKANLEVLEGRQEDDSTFCCIWTLDDDDDVEDKTKWIKANPNLGISNSEEYLETELRKARINPTLRTDCYTKLFNKWISSSEEWIPAHYISECQERYEPPCDIAYMGIDLAASWDLTAVCVLFEYDTDFYFRTYYFYPEDNVEDSPNREKYKRWAELGCLTLTPGNVTDYDFILNKIMEINNKVLIQQIGYDTWNSTQFCIKATENGLPMKPYSMSIGSLNRPTKELARLILSKKAHLYPNPIDNYCFANCRIKRDWNDNERITKQNNDDKIDGCMTMIMALGTWMSVNHWDNTVEALNF